MSLPDTAEYWDDIKRSSGYTGPTYYHIPGYECGRKHWYEAKYIDQVNCTECKLALRNGYTHTLKSAEQHRADDERKKRKILKKRIRKSIKDRPDNPVCSCGFAMIKRKNTKNGTEFYGCSNFPICKNTVSL
jgi:hypothetical protein